MRQQDGFFAQGVQYLKPLVLRNIAEAIGMHESTVSRVTTNKYMATPRGMYELKYFFTSSIPSTALSDLCARLSAIKAGHWASQNRAPAVKLPGALQISPAFQTYLRVPS